MVQPAAAAQAGMAAAIFRDERADDEVEQIAVVRRQQPPRNFYAQRKKDTVLPRILIDRIESMKPAREIEAIQNDKKSNKLRLFVVNSCLAKTPTRPQLALPRAPTPLATTAPVPQTLSAVTARRKATCNVNVILVVATGPRWSTRTAKSTNPGLTTSPTTKMSKKKRSRSTKMPTLVLLPI